MNKDEALKMAIESMENTKLGDAAYGLAPSIILDDIINACKEAVEQQDELKELVRRFFDDYLNTWERRQDGSIYRPISIGCSRVLKMEPLGELLEKMRVLSEAQPPYEEK